MIYFVVLLTNQLLPQETEPDSVRTPTMCHNTYVRVCGHVKSFQGKKSMVAFTIRPVADMNQLTCHLVSVVYAHATSNMVRAASMIFRAFCFVSIRHFSWFDFRLVVLSRCWLIVLELPLFHVR